MTALPFTESIVEDAALAWLEGLGYAALHGPDIAPGEPFAERDDYAQVVLERRLRQALQRLNPQAPPAALDEAFRDSAVQVLGDETLRAIAQELVQAVRNSVTIDWTLRENVRARIRVMVKRILRRHGYPLDKQEKAAQTVLEQAEVLCREWVSG